MFSPIHRSSAFAHCASRIVLRCGLAGLFLLLAGAAEASAQAYFSGAYAVLNLDSTTLSGPESLAADSSGNLYIADNGSGNLYKAEPQSDGTYAVTTLESGLNDLRGVAVDASGNVYYVESGLRRVRKLAVSGTTYTGPTDVATNATNGINPLAIPT